MMQVKEHRHFNSPTSSIILSTSSFISCMSHMISPKLSLIRSTPSFMSFTICCITSLALLASKRPIVQRGVRNVLMGLRTLFELPCGLQDLRYCHLNLLPCQVIELLKSVLNIRPTNQFLQICF